MNFPKYMKPAVWRGEGNILNVALFIHTKLHFLVLIVTYEHSRRRMDRQTDTLCENIRGFAFSLLATKT